MNEIRSHRRRFVQELLHCRAELAVYLPELKLPGDPHWWRYDGSMLASLRILRDFVLAPLFKDMGPAEEEQAANPAGIPDRWLRSARKLFDGMRDTVMHDLERIFTEDDEQAARAITLARIIPGLKEAHAEAHRIIVEEVPANWGSWDQESEPDTAKQKAGAAGKAGGAGAGRGTRGRA